MKQSGDFQTLSSELQESKEEVSELMRALEDLALNYDQKADALQAAYTEREKLEAELQRKDEHCVTLMNEMEVLKEEKSEIQVWSEVKFLPINNNVQVANNGNNVVIVARSD